MPILEKDQELIDSFIKNKLSPQDQKRWSIRMQDSDFVQAVHKAQDIYLAAAFEGRNQLKATFKAWDEEKDIPANIKKMALRRWWFYAAAIVLLLVLSYFLFVPESLNHEKLFEQYYAYFPDAISQTERGEFSEMNERDKIMQPYNQRDWDASVHTLEAYLKSQPKDYQIHFYYGLSLLENNQPTLAIEEFTLVQRSMDDLDYTNAAQWYEALSYLKSNQLDKAKNILTNIYESNHYKSESAAKILQKLE